ncbi:hypothetical protein Dimus_035540 [Dionaea muscipula]
MKEIISIREVTDDSKAQGFGAMLTKIFEVFDVDLKERRSFLHKAPSTLSLVTVVRLVKKSPLGSVLVVILELSMWWLTGSYRSSLPHMFPFSLACFGSADRDRDFTNSSAADIPSLGSTASVTPTTWHA